MEKVFYNKFDFLIIFYLLLLTWKLYINCRFLTMYVLKYLISHVNHRILD